jgi:hypothetical protein
MSANTRHRCGYHTTGVPLNAKPFFVEWCAVCKRRLAEGKVTGKEPLPGSIGRNSLYSQNAWRLARAKEKGERLAKRRAQ